MMMVVVAMMMLMRRRRRMLVMMMMIMMMMMTTTTLMMAILMAAWTRSWTWVKWRAALWWVWATIWRRSSSLTLHLASCSTMAPGYDSLLLWASVRVCVCLVSFLYVTLCCFGFCSRLFLSCLLPLCDSLLLWLLFASVSVLSPTSMWLFVALASVRVCFCLVSFCVWLFVALASVRVCFCLVSFCVWLFFALASVRVCFCLVSFCVWLFVALASVRVCFCLVSFCVWLFVALASVRVCVCLLSFLCVALCCFGFCPCVSVSSVSPVSLLFGSPSCYRLAGLVVIEASASRTADPDSNSAFPMGIIRFVLVA